MPDVLLIPYAVLFGVSGAVLHELTHYGTARLMNREATIDLLGMDTYYQEQDNDVAIRTMPLLLGIWSFFPLLVIQPGLPVWFMWGVYTLGGLPDDLTDMTYPRNRSDSHSGQ